MSALHCAVGHTDAIDTEDAIEALFAQTRSAPSAPRHRAVLVFSSMGYDHALILRAVRARWADAIVAGCTGTGTLSHLATYGDGVVLAVLSSDVVSFSSAVGERLSSSVADATAAATGATRAATAPISCALAFADGLRCDMDAVLGGLRAGLGHESAPILGAAAGDDWRFQRTLQFAGDRILEDAVVVLSVHGPVSVGVGVGAGWSPIGRTFTVTASEGAWIHGIDGVAPRERFAPLLADMDAQNLVEFPLAVSAPSDPDAPPSLRAVIAIDAETGSFRACGAVPEGASVRFTTATRGAILDASTTAAEAAVAALGGPPSAMFVATCAARQSVLGTAIDQERLRIATAARGHAPPVFGIYGFGELGGRDRFHNETCVVAAFGGSP